KSRSVGRSSCYDGRRGLCPSSSPTKDVCFPPPWKGWGIRRRRVYDLDANQELIALGVSNFLAGLFGGFAGGGSLSKTAVNAGAGGLAGVWHPARTAAGRGLVVKE